MKITSSIITFRIDIDFPDADVDMVYHEARANGFSGAVPSIMVEPTVHKVKGNQTPTSESVDFCINYLSGNMRKVGRGKWEYTSSVEVLPEFKKLKVEVKESSGLMMGNAHLVFEVDMQLYDSLLLRKVMTIVYGVFNKYVQYYPANLQVKA